MFENAPDIRCFLAHVAHAVRRGQLELHAWCILSTHYHLLVRSVTGELSEAMRRIQSGYVRRFNRSRRRDGSLVRGRFFSRRAHSIDYRRLLVRYIDANSVKAGLATRPAEYRFGSAYWYARPTGPRWQERSWIEAEVMAGANSYVYRPDAYARAFPERDPETVEYVVERRLRMGQPLDSMPDLLGSRNADLRAWMRRKARLADGTRPGLPVLRPDEIVRAVEDEKARGSAWRIATSRRGTRCAWGLLRVGLLRDLAGATWQEIGSSLGRSLVHAQDLGRQHARALDSNEEYATKAADLTRRLLTAKYGAGDVS